MGDNHYKDNGIIIVTGLAVIALIALILIISIGTVGLVLGRLRNFEMAQVYIQL